MTNINIQGLEGAATILGDELLYIWQSDYVVSNSIGLDANYRPLGMHNGRPYFGLAYGEPNILAISWDGEKWGHYSSDGTLMYQNLFDEPLPPSRDWLPVAGAEPIPNYVPTGSLKSITADTFIKSALSRLKV